MKAKRIIVCSSYRLRYLSQEVCGRHATIVISDSHSAEESPSRDRMAMVLRLAFRDMEDGPRAMTPDQGDQVREFMGEIIDVPTLIIACDMGAHRSPSMAMAIADYFRWGRRYIASNGNFNPYGNPPNARVYRMTFDAMARASRSAK